jgi:hypothetical protein
VPFEADDWIISIEMHGHIIGNMKWMKDGGTFNSWISSDRPPETIVDHLQKLPPDPSLKDKSGPDFRHRCIFATAKIVVSPIVLFESGMLVEIDLPANMLPTFRGRTLQTSYYLTVTMEQSSVCKRLHFPVHISGKGCQRDIYYFQSGGIVAYPPNSLPEETYLDSGFLEITSDERESLDTSGSTSAKHSPISEKFAGSPHQSSIVYSVRDVGHVCNITMPSLQLVPGTDEIVDFDFADQDQECFAIKASLRLVETQFAKDKGGVISSFNVQDKDIWSDYRLSSNAEFLRLYIYVPEDSFCSFSCPLVKVEYKLVLEFYLSSNSMDEPLSFSIDIEILEQVNLRRSRKLQRIAEAMTASVAMDKKTQFLSMLHTCLEAKLSRIPYVEVDST